MLDNKLTQDMQSWLDTEPAQRDIMAGALMVLRLNRNKHMYSMSQKAPHRMADKIEYELRKFLRIRLDGLTSDEVSRMEEETVPASFHTAGKMEGRLETDEATGIARGIRPDHDQLPEKIQALWDRNRVLYHKLKEVHETLKTLEDEQPCDRYEHLKILKELDVEIRNNMAIYDDYQLSENKSVPETSGDSPSDPEPEDPVVLSRKIQAARTYLSENKEKLRSLLLSGETEAFAKLGDKIMERINFLRSVGCPPSDESMNELTELLGI